MQSVKPSGSKRGGSPARQYYHNQHNYSCDQACPCKRLRSSNQGLSMQTQDNLISTRTPPSIVWKDFQNRKFPEVQNEDLKPLNSTTQATPSANKGQNVPNFRLSAPESALYETLSESKIISSVGQEQSPTPKGHSSISFYTKVSILTRTGIIGLERVQVDSRSLFSLLPWPIALDLGLVLYSDGLLRTTVGGRLVVTSQYCQFTIRAAGLDTTVVAGVVSGLQVLLLGRRWIEEVNLLQGINPLNPSTRYYIPVPLAVEPIGPPSKSEARENENDETAASFSEEDDDEYKFGDGIDGALEGEFSSENDYSSPLSDCELSSSQDPFAVTPSDAEESSENEHSGANENSGESEQVGEDEEEDIQICGSEDDDYRDEDYETYGEEWECEGCEQCCDEVPDPDSNHFIEKESSQMAKPGLDQNSHSLTNHLSSDPELGMSSKPGFSNRQESATPSLDKSPSGELQTSITKRQAKDLINSLNHVSRTQAGQSFKAPVEQLWPDCAESYAAKIPNPIDLGTIETKIKSNMYQSMDAFKADVLLLYQNSVDFNGIDHAITRAALEVRDTILKTISETEVKGSTRAPISV